MSKRKKAKHKKTAQSPKSQRSSSPSSRNPVTSVPTAPANPSPQWQGVQPEQMSLDAHQHIQTYRQSKTEPTLTKEDLNAVLRLSQHLRLFGLLSAIGYINQSNAQDGKIRTQTVPVWGCLLAELLGKTINPQESQERQTLMAEVVQMTKNEPAQYMAMWRKSLQLAHHWNFWARAYCEGE